MDVKVAWQNAFEKQLRALDATKPLIWAGDVNVAPTAKGMFELDRRTNVQQQLKCLFQIYEMTNLTGIKPQASQQLNATHLLECSTPP